MGTANYRWVAEVRQHWQGHLCAGSPHLDSWFYIFNPSPFCFSFVMRCSSSSYLSFKERKGLGGWARQNCLNMGCFCSKAHTWAEQQSVLTPASINLQQQKWDVSGVFHSSACSWAMFPIHLTNTPLQSFSKAGNCRKRQETSVPPPPLQAFSGGLYLCPSKRQKKDAECHQ